MSDRPAAFRSMADQRRRSVWWDAAMVVVLALLSTFIWWADPATFTPTNAVFAVTGIVALLWRHSAPTISLIATGTLAIVSALIGTGGVTALPVAIASAAVVASGRRIQGAVGAGVVAIVLSVIFFVRDGRVDGTPAVAAALALALGVTIGLVQDARRRLLQSAYDRAERAEALREAEASRAVAEERVRIARELHDVLAHQIAVIGVQTGLADYVLDEDSDAARTALHAARDASSTALRELSTLLQLLRQTGDEAATSPAPSLRRLDDLLDDARRTGLKVEARVEGSMPDLPPVSDLAAYRVLQEGLTNAHKYGNGHAVVDVGTTDGVLRIRIRNQVARGRTEAASSGMGLIGMRERVEGIGGTLVTTRTLEEFTLEAAVPIGRIDLSDEPDGVTA